MTKDIKYHGLPTKDEISETAVGNSNPLWVTLYTIDRQVDRQIDRQIDIQIDRQIERQIDRYIYRTISR